MGRNVLVVCLFLSDPFLTIVAALCSACTFGVYFGRMWA